MTTTAKGVTPEMVEAGAKACRDITFNALTMDECRDAVRAALEAAISVSSGGLAVKALRKANEAIAEYVRYLDGGEMRGSYDGKPEREALRKAGYATLSALLALDRTTLPAAEGEKA